MAGEEVDCQHFVYMACCRNGSFYVGYATNVERRIAMHNAGRGAKYTRANRPVTLAATWQFANKGDALRAERELKRVSHDRKRTLAEAQVGSAGSEV